MSKQPVDINKLSYEEVKDLLNGIDDEKSQHIEKIKSNAEDESAFYNPLNYIAYRKALETNIAQCASFYEKLRKLLKNASTKGGYQKDENGFPVDENFLSSLVVINDNPGGSPGAKIVQAPDGTKFVMKRQSEKGGYAHLKNEYDANQFYSIMGAKVPDSKLFDKNPDNAVLLSKYIEDGISLNDWWKLNRRKPKELEKMRKKLREHFSVDVLLGNWDVVGQGADNILIDSKGTPYRIDNGGSMGFRAQGEKKQTNDWKTITNFDAKKPDWKQSAYFDDIWTMTGNGGRIGLDIDRTIPEYFGECDVFEIVEDICSKDWTNAIQSLSEEDKWAIELRLEEARQLFERGNRYVKIEDMSVFPRETMLKILDYSYQMSKGGFRYAVSQQTTPTSVSAYSPSKIGWFNEAGNFTQTLTYKSNVKDYKFIGDYLNDFVGDYCYDFIQESNYGQAGDSYDLTSCLKKIYIARNNGLDIKKIGNKIDKDNGNFNDFIKECERQGYYMGASNVQKLSMNTAMKIVWRKNDKIVDILCNGLLKNDAAMQLILENTPVVGADTDSGTIILIRTEDKKILSDSKGSMPKEGEITIHKSGICESHSHIKTTSPNSTNVTGVRVPFSRVHGLWFIQRKMSDKNDKYMNNNTMFLNQKENEITADTHNLSKIYLGDKTQYPNAAKVKAGIEKYEKTRPDDSILKKLK